MTEDSLTINLPAKCVFCGKDSNIGIYLTQPIPPLPPKWDFEGEGSCLECYMKHLCHKYAKEAINAHSNHQS